MTVCAVFFLRGSTLPAVFLVSLFSPVGLSLGLYIVLG